MSGFTGIGLHSVNSSDIKRGFINLRPTYNKVGGAFTIEDSTTKPLFIAGIVNDDTSSVSDKICSHIASGAFKSIELVDESTDVTDEGFLTKATISFNTDKVNIDTDLNINGGLNVTGASDVNGVLDRKSVV